MPDACPSGSLRQRTAQKKTDQQPLYRVRRVGCALRGGQEPQELAQHGCHNAFRLAQVLRLEYQFSQGSTASQNCSRRTSEEFLRLRRRLHTLDTRLRQEGTSLIAFRCLDYIVSQLHGYRNDSRVLTCQEMTGGNISKAAFELLPRGLEIFQQKLEALQRLLENDIALRIGRINGGERSADAGKGRKVVSRL